MDLTAIVLTFTTLFSLLFFLVGGLIVWTYKQHLDNQEQSFTFHPEMFDENGNLIRDTLYSFRIEDEEDYFDED